MDKAAAWISGQGLGKNWFNLTGVQNCQGYKKTTETMEKEQDRKATWAQHFLSQASECFCTSTFRRQLGTNAEQGM